MCEVPASLCLQSQSYSSYKSHTTLKGLLAVAPNGAINFVSQLYTGSTSDRELTKQSGFLDLLKSVPRGKSVLADKGFDVQYLLVSHGLLLNIPQDQLHWESLMYKKHKQLHGFVYMWKEL